MTKGVCNNCENDEGFLDAGDRCGNCGHTYTPIELTLDELIQILTDRENQPHQYVNNPAVLKQEIERLNK